MHAIATAFVCHLKTHGLASVCSTAELFFSGCFVHAGPLFKAFGKLVTIWWGAFCCGPCDMSLGSPSHEQSEVLLGHQPAGHEHEATATVDA